MTTQRIVTEQKGSWRWQNAFRVVAYEAPPSKTRPGRWLWRPVSRTCKMSEPQLRRAGLNVIPRGSLDRKWIPDDQLNVAPTAIVKAKGDSR